MAHLAHNEDSTNFFCRHPEEDMSVAGLNAFIEQYVGTQVDEIVFNTNCSRSSWNARAKQPIWDGFDPEQGNDQPYLAGITQPLAWKSVEVARQHSRDWAHNALRLHQRGIDVYAHWTGRCRERDISPWISMRMNDVHWANQPGCPIHDRFWREHPEFRRAPWQKGLSGQCLDYGRAEVREYQMAYVREIVQRCDIDGFELDWMRHGNHFRPGREADGRAILTEFTGEVRSVLDERQKEVGHPIRLSARAPSHPETSLALGMNAIAWAREGLIDRLIVTPFLFVEFDMPIELWKQMLEGTGVELAAGLYPTLTPYRGGPRHSMNPEAVRGAAATQLARGADMIYLFNFMDYSCTPEAKAAYQHTLREIASLETMAGKSRRHVLTFADHKAPGEAKDDPLPHDCKDGWMAEFRLPVGPTLLPQQKAQVRMEVRPRPADTGAAETFQVWINGEACAPAGDVAPPPGWEEPTLGFDVPATALTAGHNLIELRNGSGADVQVTWVEIAISNEDGSWPEPGSLDLQEIYPPLPEFRKGLC